MNMPVFECLFFLENTSMYIIEVKRTDLPADAEPSHKFKWLRIAKTDLETETLIFQSMDSAGDLEERFFEQGYLKFNEIEGTFIEKYNSGQHPLHHRKNWKISTELSNHISDYLQRG